jgi:SAM-dependent methyltransferase
MRFHQEAVERWQVGHGDMDEEIVVAGQHVHRADLGEGEREGLDDLPAERADLERDECLDGEADLGQADFGVESSATMIAAGRRDYPQVEFREGDLLALPAADGEFAAAVAFYSIIHLKHGELRQAFGEIRRVLRPGGRALMAFHVGSEVRHLAEWWGHAVNLDFRFFQPAEIADALQSAGLPVEMSLERVNYPHETETRRAYLLVRNQHP